MTGAAAERLRERDGHGTGTGGEGRPLLPPRPALLVAIHDVTPAWDGAVRTLWELCDAVGVRPAMLVVPEWHGRCRLEDHPGFVRWIGACAELGAELFLHGERHDEVGLPRGWRDSLRAFGRTAGEGEFLTLDRPAAARRIGRGVARLRALGLQPIGFVPPAWLAREQTFLAAREEGLVLSEDVEHVRVLRPGPFKVHAPVVRWSGRSAFRAWTSAGVAAWHHSRANARPIVRIALHPMDLAHRATRRSMERTLARWAADRTVVTYASLLPSGESTASATAPSEPGAAAIGRGGPG